MAALREELWFKIVSFIVLGFLAGVLLANLIYFQKIYHNRGGGGVTQGEALAMLWLNAIFFVVAVFLFIWALVRLFISQESRQKAVQALGAMETGFDISFPVPESGANVRQPAGSLAQGRYQQPHVQVRQQQPIGSYYE